MLDEQDQGTRIGVAVALGVVLLLIVGLLGWLTMRGAKAPSAPEVRTAVVAPAPVAAVTANAVPATAPR
jgi:hypothetical protein